MTSAPQDTCWTILRSATKGDQDAKSKFAELYEPLVRAFFQARWRGRILRGEVDDAVQEVFIDCLKPNGVLDRADPERGEFRGLLFGVSRTIACRFESRVSARGRLRPEDDAWLHEVASDEAGQATLFDRKWAQTLMRQARRLQRRNAAADGEAGARRVEVLRRRFQGDEPIRDIAAAWGLPVPAVHQLYRTARAEFHRCLRAVVARHATHAADLDAECRRLFAMLR